MDKFRTELCTLIGVATIWSSTCGYAADPQVGTPSTLAKCLFPLKTVAQLAWRRILRPSKSNNRAMEKWADTTGASENRVKISHKRYPLKTEATFYVPKMDEATISAYERDVVPNTVGIMMTKDWYVDRDAPFHTYWRVGNRVFRITKENKIIEQTYGDTLRMLAERRYTDGRNPPETRETVFTLSEPAKRALLEYLEGRKNENIRGTVIKTRYDIGAVDTERYDDKDTKVEMCVTNLLSIMSPRFTALIPELKLVQKEMNFYPPPTEPGKESTAKDMFGYLTFTATPDAVVLWAPDAQQKIKQVATDGPELSKVYHNFLATIGGKQVIVEATPYEENKTDMTVRRAMSYWPPIP